MTRMGKLLQWAKASLNRPAEVNDLPWMIASSLWIAVLLVGGLLYLLYYIWEKGKIQ